MDRALSKCAILRISVVNMAIWVAQCTHQNRHNHIMPCTCASAKEPPRSNSSSNGITLPLRRKIVDSIKRTDHWIYFLLSWKNFPRDARNIVQTQQHNGNYTVCAMLSNGGYRALTANDCVLCIECKNDNSKQTWKQHTYTHTII